MATAVRQFDEARQGGRRLRMVLGTGIVLVALLVTAGAFYLGYHLYKFPPGETDLLAEYSKEHGSVATTNPLPGLFSLALSPSCGVLWYCPTLFLSTSSQGAGKGSARSFLRREVRNQENMREPNDE